MAGIAWNWTEREMEFGKEDENETSEREKGIPGFTHHSVSPVPSVRDANDQIDSSIPVLDSTFESSPSALFSWQHLGSVSALTALLYRLRSRAGDACAILMMMIIGIDVMIYLVRVQAASSLLHPFSPPVSRLSLLTLSILTIRCIRLRN
jgi:hypothetical protein